MENIQLKKRIQAMESIGYFTIEDKPFLQFLKPLSKGNLIRVGQDFQVAQVVNQTNGDIIDEALGKQKVIDFINEYQGRRRKLPKDIE